jgi:hypothetical protein
MNQRRVSFAWAPSLDHRRDAVLTQTLPASATTALLRKHVVAARVMNYGLASSLALFRAADCHTLVSAWLLCFVGYFAHVRIVGESWRERCRRSAELGVRRSPTSGLREADAV